ncbi:MAG TPA: radical SAM protein, partial [bacterium]|nr:radical SAM protein [bacterium]
MYKTIFGPVPSRRLGMSLGIDLTPHKTCSFDCIYCECGATTNLTNIRKNFVDSALVKNELLIFFEKNINNLPEILTFSGSGEPTLAKNLGEIINFCKKNFALPVCVLTNSS